MNRSGPYLGDELGRFVAPAGMSHISERALCSLKRTVLDTLGGAIAAGAHQRNVHARRGQSLNQEIYPLESWEDSRLFELPRGAKRVSRS